MRAVLIAGLLLASCGRSASDRQAGESSAGGRLEAAAIGAGLVINSSSRGVGGVWSRDTDRVCAVPTGPDVARVGLLIDYGSGLGCVASGTMRRRGGGKLDLTLGNDCRIQAAFEGERITFPAGIPAACDRFCTGRASLAAMSVDRQSDSVAEALSLRAPSGRRLCAG